MLREREVVVMPFRSLLAIALSWLAFAGLARAACVTDPMMQGQDPQAEFEAGYYNLVQSDGCNIRLRRATTLSGLVTAANPIIYAAGCSNVWAPEIHWLTNRWYLYYSVDTGTAGAERVHVAQSSGSNPSGPYAELGVLNPGYWNIDGSVFVSTNGQLYFICSGSPSGTQNIYIAPMSNPYTLGAALTLISSPTQSWELNGTVNEGPFGFVHNGRVFIVYSASGCWTDDYCLGLLTLTGANPLDPASWTKSGPVFSKQPGAYGPGHNCVVQDASGQWWNVYHANDLSGQGCGGYRQLRAQRVNWDADNTPYFGTPVPIGSLITEDSGFLVCEFPLTETSGTSAATSVCGPAGVLVGSPLWMNPGLKFNGISDYVDCGPALGNDVQSALTLAAWIKANAFIDWASVMTKGTNTSPYAMQTWHDGSLRFTANWGTPSGSVGGGSWNSTAKMGINQWYHVAVTYDGATVRFYLNGVLDANQPAVALHFGVVNEPLTIGADLPGGHEYFNGVIRDARLYGRALSGAEINSVFGINHAPVLSPVSNQTVIAGQTLLVTNSATDPDAPPQTLTYSLLSGPAGAAINQTNGVVSWRPTVAQSPSTNVIAVAVADNGSPSLSATQSFQVTVLRPGPPLLGPGWLTGGTFQLAVTGALGPDYSLYASSNLAPANWSLVGTTNPPAMPFLFADPAATNFNQRFYRVLLGP
jgi:GH43 family beta-xylosidase